jgi:hypothetical protein
MEKAKRRKSIRHVIDKIDSCEKHFIPKTNRERRMSE